MQKIAVIAIASLVLAGSACAQMKTQAPAQHAQPVVTSASEPSLESAKRMERDEAIKMVKEGKAVFIDVRPKDQYDIGHIKGSINIPLTDLMTRIKDLPAHKDLITYCA
jgi:3-mercaptopyruvate sulfurtransferase SseA